MIKIVMPGIYSSVQDCGRRGFRKFGVPISGAMDLYALKKGNIILGNEPCSAGIEITGPGFECEFLCDAEVCITGADLGAVVNNSSQVIKPGSVLKAIPGDSIKFTQFNCGLRAYILVKGGIDGPVKMGSRSMFRGEKLKTGDVLEIGSAEMKEGKGYYANSYIEESCEYVLSVNLGPDSALYPGKYIKNLLKKTYTVSPSHDRMGIRLEMAGDIIPVKRNIVTKPVFPGCIQLPGNGKPIIIMCDGQSTGGYPVWAVVHREDLRIAGQLKSGDKVNFIHV